jgi:uncharacterized glyoxalase superfamily protein PhnB
MSNAERTTNSSNETPGASLTASALWASLTVKDVPASVTWCRDLLGFTSEQRYEREGKLVAVRMRAGNVCILLNQDNGAHGLDRTKGEGFSMQIMTSDNIDAIADRIKSFGAVLDLEPTDMPWGPRVFRVTDPDGFKFAISSEMKSA